MFCLTVKDELLSPYKRTFKSVVLHVSVVRFSANRSVDKYGVLRCLLLFRQRKLKKPGLQYAWTVNYLILITWGSVTFLGKADDPIKNLIGHFIVTS
jgi:hypothetical protein